MSKHTPGPWAISTFRGALGRTITRESHLKKPYGCSIDAVRCADTYAPTIATVGEHAHHFTDDESLANAHLIAAAPDHALLLAAICDGNASVRPLEMCETMGHFDTVVRVGDVDYHTNLVAFGCPELTDELRKALKPEPLYIERESHHAQQAKT